MCRLRFEITNSHTIQGGELHQNTVFFITIFFCRTKRMLCRLENNINQLLNAFLLLVLSLKANLSHSYSAKWWRGFGWGGEGGFGGLCRVGEVLVCFRSLIVSTDIFLFLSVSLSWTFSPNFWMRCFFSVLSRSTWISCNCTNPRPVHTLARATARNKPVTESADWRTEVAPESERMPQSSKCSVGFVALLLQWTLSFWKKKERRLFRKKSAGLYVWWIILWLYKNVNTEKKRFGERAGFEHRQDLKKRFFLC